MLRLLVLLTTGLVFAVVTSCGSSSSSTDQETSSASAMMAAEDAADAAADDLGSNGISSGRMEAPDWDAVAASASSDTDVTYTRACTKGSDGVVTVTITISGSGTKTITRPKVTVSHALSGSGTITRKWTPPTGQSIDCTSATGAVKVAWKTDAVVEGLKLDATIDGSRNATKTRTKSSGETKTITDNRAISGTRAVTWATATSSSTSVITRTKSLTQSVTHTRTRTKEDGTTSSFTNTLVVASTAPLKFQVERDSSSGKLLKKTVLSGTTTGTHADGTKVESAFSNVVFDFASTNENVCLPTSGTISGSVYESGSTTASKTFVIAFGTSTDSSVSIAYDGGTAEDYPDFNAKGCDLERES